MDYNKISSHYDNWYEWYFFTKEDEEITKMINYKIWSILDVWCWTWLWIKITWVKSNNYLWLDISDKLLEIALKKNRNYLFLNQNILDTTLDVKVNLTIALYWVMNYLTNEEIDKIIESSDYFFLMDYKDWYHPVCYPNNEFPKRKFDKLKYTKYLVKPFNNYYIYTNVNKWK